MTPDDSTSRAVAALNKAVYFLDRGLAPGPKVRAFTNAADIVGSLEPGELDARVAAGTLTELRGIGASTGSVIEDAIADRASSYLDRIDRDTACPAGIGLELRKALRGDLHCHTTWSDGGASIEAMAHTAMSLGHDYLAITDHSPRLTIAHGLSTDRLREQTRQIDTLRAELAPFRILTGMEVDIHPDGTLDLPDECLAELDVVVASVHSKLNMDEQSMTERMVTAAASPHVDILGHCTGRKIVGSGRPRSSFDADLVFAACARFETAIEINCRPERRDPPGDLLERALEWGCKFSIDTDAHAPGQMEWLNWGCDFATEHQIHTESIINTWRTDELLAWTAAHPGS